ncbi:unnamed protein product, partial [marine sediment metagenome]
TTEGTEYTEKRFIIFYVAHDFEPGLTRFWGLPGFTKDYLFFNHGNHG